MTSIISDYSPAFRSPEDFWAEENKRRQDAALRCACCPARRAREERQHKAAMGLSEVYRLGQSHLEAALKGVDSGFRGEFISAEVAIIGFGR